MAAMHIDHFSNVDTSPSRLGQSSQPPSPELDASPSGPWDHSRNGRRGSGLSEHSEAPHTQPRRRSSHRAAARRSTARSLNAGWAAQGSLALEVAHIALCAECKHGPRISPGDGSRRQVSLFLASSAPAASSQRSDSWLNASRRVEALELGERDLRAMGPEVAVDHARRTPASERLESRLRTSAAHVVARKRSPKLVR
jgi:hypothetical protein